MGLIRTDPTLTGYIRQRFEADVRRRILWFQRQLWKLIVTEDVFGLETGSRATTTTTSAPTATANALVVNKGQWQPLSTPEQLAEFQRWVGEKVEEGVLEGVNIGDADWIDQYAKAAYEKGIKRGYAQANQTSGVTAGGQQEHLRFMLGGPIGKAKIAQMASRVFTDLKNVTQVMAKQMGVTLTQGLAEGISPRELARRLNKSVEGIGKARSLMIARTEVIRAHAEGQLDSLEEMGVQEVGVLMEWQAAADACPICAELANSIRTIQEARGVIPVHPNCRCAWAPLTEYELKKLNTEKAKTAIAKLSKQPKLPKTVKPKIEPKATETPVEPTPTPTPTKVEPKPTKPKKVEAAKTVAKPTQEKPTQEKPTPGKEKVAKEKATKPVKVEAAKPEKAAKPAKVAKAAKPAKEKPAKDSGYKFIGNPAQSAFEIVSPNGVSAGLIAVQDGKWAATAGYADLGYYPTKEAAIKEVEKYLKIKLGAPEVYKPKVEKPPELPPVKPIAPPKPLSWKELVKEDLKEKEGASAFKKKKKKQKEVPKAPKPNLPASDPFKPIAPLNIPAHILPKSKPLDAFIPQKEHKGATYTTSKEPPITGRANAEAFLMGANTIPTDEAQRAALKRYTGGFYSAVNASLRGGDERDLGTYSKTEIKKAVEEMDKAFASKKAELPRPVVVYRGVGSRTANEIQAHFREHGTKAAYTARGYSSTTINPQVARDFAGSQEAILKIVAKKGIFVKPISHHEEEDELLLDRDTKFRVLKVESGIVSDKALKGAGVVIHLEQV